MSTRLMRFRCTQRIPGMTKRRSRLHADDNELLYTTDKKANKPDHRRNINIIN